MKSPLVALAFLLLASPAFALPDVGATRPSLRLTDAWDRTLAVSGEANRPILVVYEDRDSAKQNQPLKDELASLARGGMYKDVVTLLAIADVAAYDFWPARGFVKSAVRTESEKIETPIYCDWNGGARQALGLRRGVSNVLLYGRDGRVLFAHEGPLSREERAVLVGLVRAQLRRPRL